MMLGSWPWPWNFDDTLAVLIQYTRVTDRRMDGQMKLAWHMRAIACMLSRVIKSPMSSVSVCHLSMVAILTRFLPAR